MQNSVKIFSRNQQENSKLTFFKNALFCQRVPQPYPHKYRLKTKLHDCLTFYKYACYLTVKKLSIKQNKPCTDTTDYDLTFAPKFFLNILSNAA